MTPQLLAGRLRSVLWHPTTINLATFFTLSLAVFHRNSDFLFYGTDGHYEVTLIEQFARFSPSWFGFAGDTLRGLGNMVFPVNPRWIPSYILGITWPGGDPNFALTYAINSSEMFIATILAARLVRLPPLVGILAAWVTPLAVMPYFGFGLIPHTVAAFPHYATSLAISTVLTAFVVTVDPKTFVRAMLWGLCAILCIGYLVIIAPTIVILGAPMTIVCSVIALIAADSRGQLVMRLVMFTLIAIACALLYGPYLAGLFLDTAANFFRNLSIRPATLQDISMVFWPMFPVGRILIIGGMAGALMAAYLGRDGLRLLAVGLFATELLFLTAGMVHYFVFPFWFGPALWYFEGFLFLYFALFLVTGPFLAIRAAYALLQSIIALPDLRMPRTLSSLAWHLTGVGIALSATGYVLARGTTGTSGPYAVPTTQADTIITRTIENEIGFNSNRQFRGRVADFMGRSIPSSNDYNVWNFLRMFSLRATGNMHSGDAMWQIAVPTLTEYSPHMTPAYFAFIRRFFTLPDDIQTRNWLQMRNIQPRLLATLGVRFAITDAKFDGEASLRDEIPIQVSEASFREVYAPEVLHRHAFSIYLYEFPNVNVGDYSPTIVRQAKDAADTLDILSATEFDPRRVAITHEEISEELVPATLQNFSVEHGRFHVRATSPGWSLLLLPIEYSRCLTVSNEGTAPDNTRMRLVRADLLLTGLVFENSIDVAMRYFTGPFSNPLCRLEDSHDYRALSISDAFEHRPEFLPK